MSKAKAIKKTDYTETELIYLGLIAMKIRMKESRNESQDSESWDHYDALVKAYDARYQVWKKLYPALKGIL